MHDFFQNTDCEYFPCHHGLGRASFSCLFCYCPLYAWNERCGGDYTINEKGYKDCSTCLFPHKKENYPCMMDKIRQMYSNKPED